MIPHTLDECCTRCDVDHRYCRDIHSECPVCELEPKSCGRVDDHDEHEWRAGWNTEPWMRHTYRCTGDVVIEGGALS